MKRSGAIIILFLCIGFSLVMGDHAWATSYNLDNTSGSFHTVTLNGGSGAVIQEFSNGSGSGVYTRMYAIQSPNSTTEAQGYNSTVSNKQPFDQKSGVGIPATQVSSLPLVTIGGVQYLQFLADYGSSTALTIASIQVYYNSNPDQVATTVAQLPTLGTLIYSSNGDTVNVSNISKGSGNSNEAIYIPYSLFPADHNQYVYFYVDFTNMVGGGYDELAYNKQLTGVGPSTPEAHNIWGGLLMGCLLVGGVLKRRFQKPVQVE